MIGRNCIADVPHARFFGRRSWSSSMTCVQLNRSETLGVLGFLAPDLLGCTMQFATGAGHVLCSGQPAKAAGNPVKHSEEFMPSRVSLAVSRAANQASSILSHVPRIWRAPMCEVSRTAGQGQGQALVQNGQIPAPELHSPFAPLFSPPSCGVDLDCLIKPFFSVTWFELRLGDVKGSCSDGESRLKFFRAGT